MILTSLDMAAFQGLVDLVEDGCPHIFIEDDEKDTCSHTERRSDADCQESPPGRGIKLIVNQSRQGHGNGGGKKNGENGVFQKVDPVEFGNILFDGIQIGNDHEQQEEILDERNI